MHNPLSASTPAKFVIISVPALAAGTVSRSREIARTLGLEFFESTQTGMPCSIQMPANLADMELLTDKLQAAKLEFRFSPFNLSIADLHPAVLERTRFFNTSGDFGSLRPLDPAVLARIQLHYISATA